MHLFGSSGVSLAKTEDYHSKNPSAQVAVAKKAAKSTADTNTPALPPALIAANEEHIANAALAADTAHHLHDRLHAHGARAPPTVRLLSKAEILAITGVTFPTVWAWMRAGTFPRSRVVGGKSMWLSSEIEQWLMELPLRALKGDAEVEEVA
jgi:predicted DNA-binding transcriptional regulator AlpA